DQEHHVSLAGRRLVEGRTHEPDLALASDEARFGRGDRPRVRTIAEHDRSGDALGLPHAELARAKLTHTFEAPRRGRRDEDLSHAGVAEEPLWQGERVAGGED